MLCVRGFVCCVFIPVSWPELLFAPLEADELSSSEPLSPVGPGGFLYPELSSYLWKPSRQGAAPTDARGRPDWVSLLTLLSAEAQHRRAAALLIVHLAVSAAGPAALEVLHQLVLHFGDVAAFQFHHHPVGIFSGHRGGPSRLKPTLVSRAGTLSLLFHFCFMGSDELSLGPAGAFRSPHRPRTKTQSPPEQSAGSE